jgi:hypothetical protein
MLGVSKNFFAQALSSLTKYLGMPNIRIKPYINQTSLVNAECALKIFLAVILASRPLAVSLAQKPKPKTDIKLASATNYTVCYHPYQRHW